MLNKIIKYFLENRLITIMLLILLVGWGVIVSPFDWKTDVLPNDPVPVDAIPNLGENQQIGCAKWTGRSPQDFEDQITYPLTTYMLGIPGVKSIRSSSVFGFSSIYIIFEEDVDFYWSRSRVLTKLNSLPAGTLPDGVQPTLGPDATALGQIYWYTLEGRDPNGEPCHQRVVDLRRRDEYRSGMPYQISRELPQGSYGIDLKVFTDEGLSLKDEEPDPEVRTLVNALQGLDTA